jgi:hypothetical protein
LPNPYEVAAYLATHFDGTRTILLDAAVEHALYELGVVKLDAFQWLTDGNLMKVVAALQAKIPEDLPFDISSRRPFRLVGKERPRLGDSPMVGRIRAKLRIQGELLGAVHGLSSQDFERLCARMMRQSGAPEAYAIASGDEGGIDLYGRIPVTLRSELPAGLIRTGLTARPFLFLGQCKRYGAAPIGRADLQLFAGQVRDCLSKYRNVGHPPSHRVPDDYYNEDETCLRFFFTTSGFTGGAVGYAGASNIALVNGRRIAQLLILWDIGIRRLEGAYQVDPEALRAWAAD